MGIAETRGTQARNRKPIVCRSRTGIENDMARLGPKCTGCCVRLNTCNAVTNDTHTQHTHAHTHTHTHTPQSFQQNEEYKILWDFNIQEVKIIEDKRTDIVCINKRKRGCRIIYFAIPCNQNIAIKEQEKNDKYQDLRIELQNV